jgi:hypothetical protein
MIEADSPARDLVSGLIHSWDRNATILIVTIYMDASGNHAGAHTMVLGGSVGTFGQWGQFDRKWRKFLAKDGVTHFHAQHARKGKGEYSGWDFLRRHRHIDRAKEIVQAHTLMGFNIILSEEDYRNHFVQDSSRKSVMIDSMYGLCFRIMLSTIPELLIEKFGGDNLKVLLVHELGDKNLGDAARIFKMFKKQAPSDQTAVIVSRTDAEKKQFYGLQAADLIAYMAYDVERSPPLDQFLDVPQRGGIEDGVSVSGLRSPIYRIEANEAVLSELRAKLITKTWKS